MTNWKKRSPQEIQERIKAALKQNRSFYEEPILGMPASYLDSRIFPKDSPILKGAPFLQTLINNPNHIGCHTLTQSEETFKGTQEIERDLLEIVACDIFKAEKGKFDGYVASGGTEANIQAVWIYREYFKQEFKAKHEEIGILCSEDTHYSLSKASNLLAIDIRRIPVDPENRNMDMQGISLVLKESMEAGKKYIIFNCNMMTTMFGSVDNLDSVVSELEKTGLEYKIHLDCAYGGFFYPFSNPDSNLNFEHQAVTSITVDAHKMVQAPYGTGIFLIRKGFINYTHNHDASYVKGEDYTLIGSRSGANAIAVWMILNTYGKYGWQEKSFILKRRTDWLCEKLDELGIDYYRNSFSNIVAIKAPFITKEIAEKYYLVPDNHHKPKWYKLIVMDHVDLEQLEPLLGDLSGVSETV